MTGPVGECHIGSIFSLLPRFEGLLGFSPWVNEYTVVKTVTTSVTLVCRVTHRNHRDTAQPVSRSCQIRGSRSTNGEDAGVSDCISGFCSLGQVLYPFIRIVVHHVRLGPRRSLDRMCAPTGFWKMLNSMLFISHITVPGSSEPFMTQGQMPNSGMQDMYNQNPSGAMSNLGMGQRQQFPYGTSYDRR